jgi:hypothetical protein
VREDHAAASEWADRGAKAPNAHVHIRAIAALANELAGNHQASRRWAAEVHRNDSSYCQDRFLAAFPFRDDTTRSGVTAALTRLGL